MSRQATLRNLTHTINMMEKNSVMTIACNSAFISMLKEARDIIRDSMKVVQCEECIHAEECDWRRVSVPGGFCTDGEVRECK